jgi:glycolate oxidase
MRMPEPDAGVIARRAEIVAAMRAIVPGEGVIADADELKAYDCDGLMAYKGLPLIVVLPETTAQVSRVLRYCNEHKVKIVPRGAGTGLSGGALPMSDAITLGLSKFNRILEIDFENRCVVAQPGVTNLAITPAFITRRTRRARSPAPSAATWPRTRAACIA